MFPISERGVLVKAETSEVRGPDPLVVCQKSCDWLRLAAISQVHELVVAHMHYEYTYRAIRQRFRWQGMSTDVKKVIDACVVCAERGYDAGLGLAIWVVMAIVHNHIVIGQYMMRQSNQHAMRDGEQEEQAARTPRRS
jgi:hypothetical protein